MHKVLVPVDGSAGSLRAVQHVARIALEAGSIEVVLLNVQEPPLLYGEIQVYVSRDEAERCRLEASKRALAEAEKTLGGAGVKFTSLMLEGKIAETIAKCAEEQGCDGIIMGTRGKGALASMVMGSVPTRVIHLSPLPVTLVK